MTNADMIRSMSDEELAVTIACPNDTGEADIECDKGDDCNCCECCLNWLKSEADTYGQEDWKQAVMRTFLGGRA